MYGLESVPIESWSAASELKSSGLIQFDRISGSVKKKKEKKKRKPRFDLSFLLSPLEDSSITSMWGDCTLTEMLHLLVGCGALHTDGQPERRTCFINCIKLDIYTPLSVQRFEQALSFYSTALYLEAHCLTTHTHAD